MPTNRKPLWPWIVAVVVLAPVLYVLSVGPVLWIARRTPMSPSMARIFGWYSYPLLWLTSHSGPLGKYLMQYIQFWFP